VPAQPSIHQPPDREVTKRPVVSVIVPAWSAAGTLGRALDSVLEGATVDLECVVVDDGSTDGTGAIAEARAAEDDRIVVLRRASNEGVSAARNQALAIASGEWLTFLDADDRLLPGGLAALVAGARMPGVRAVVGQRIWTDGRRRWRSVQYNIPDIRTSGRRSLASHPGLVQYASVTGKLFHRSVAAGLSFQGRVLGDQPWCIRALIRAGDGILVVADDVYEWSRPPRGARTTSITATKYGSARLAAEAARVAIGALADVATEANVSIADASDRARVVDAYFQRLVRSDLAGPVVRAVSHNDPGGAELFDAIGAFLDAAPAGLVDGSDAVAAAILRPPLERWRGFRDPARAAYLRLLQGQLRTHPRLAGRVSRATLIAPALTVLQRSGSRRAGLFDLLLLLNWPIAVGFRAVRRGRYAWRALHARSS